MLGATTKVLTRNVLLIKVLNTKIGLRVVLTARCRHRALRTQLWTKWLDLVCLGKNRSKVKSTLRTFLH